MSSEVTLDFPHRGQVLVGGGGGLGSGSGYTFVDPDVASTYLEPGVLVDAVEYSESGERPATSPWSGDGLVIGGDNLMALASLVPVFEGRIPLIYVDPPYNTGSGSFAYEDRFPRDVWLTFMENRLRLARRLLSPSGAIYVQLDYHQVHYAKVLMDSIFGEENFQREIIWRIGWVSGFKARQSNWVRNHDTILFYSRDRSRLRFDKTYIPQEDFKSIASGSVSRYPVEDVWNGSEYDDLNSIAIMSFSGEKVSKMLGLPEGVKGQKPEKLMERIIRAHTSEGDVVLDLFGGTGTTAAAAMKMGRRFIVCEQLDRCLDIIVGRLRRVIGGDSSGISRRSGWKGGGSFVRCDLSGAGNRPGSGSPGPTGSDLEFTERFYGGRWD